MTSLWSTGQLSCHVYICPCPPLCDREQESRHAGPYTTVRPSGCLGKDLRIKWRCTWWREACPNRSIPGHPARLGTSHAAIPSPTCLCTTDQQGRANTDADIAGPMSMSNAIHVHVHPTDGTLFFFLPSTTRRKAREGGAAACRSILCRSCPPASLVPILRNTRWQTCMRLRCPVTSCVANHVVCSVSPLALPCAAPYRTVPYRASALFLFPLPALHLTTFSNTTTTTSAS